MGLQAVMLVSMPMKLTGELHNKIERELQTTLEAVETDLLKSVAIKVPETNEFAPASANYSWYEVDLFKPFGGVLFSDGYPRGSIRQYTKLAETVEQMLPSARVWYGDSERMNALSIFDRPERERLLKIPSEGNGQ